MPSPITVANILERAAFFLNDTNRYLFTDEKLLPAFNIALDDLKEEFEDYGISLANQTSSAITITAGETEIGGPNGPALPNDFMVAINLYERSSGTEQDFLKMRKVDFLPKTEVLTGFLIYWTYQNQIIKFLGATADVEVKMDYVANRLVDADTPEAIVVVKNAKSYLSYRTAALAARYSGENETRADSLDGEARRSIDQLLNLDIKQKQNQVTRRLPFRAGFKSRGYW